MKLISTDLPIGVKYEAGVSAQLKSAAILAGMNSYGNTIIIEKDKSRDHTENMLLKNYHLIRINNGKRRLIKIFGNKYINSLHTKIPGDPSSAAFFTALTVLRENSSIKIKMLVSMKLELGFIGCLKKVERKFILKTLKRKIMRFLEI